MLVPTFARGLDLSFVAVIFVTITYTGYKYIYIFTFGVIRGISIYTYLPVSLLYPRGLAYYEPIKKEGYS